MGLVVADCKECGSRNISMTLRGYSRPQQPRNQHDLSTFGYVVAVCAHCERPALFTVDMKGSATWEGVDTVLQSYIGGNLSNQSLSASSYLVAPFTAARSEGNLPEHLPDDVEKALIQAESNFGLPDHEEAAATMYRRALERAVKAAYPDLSGTLASKIKKLVGDGVLPQALGDWADQVRFVGNDGAHDDGVSQGDLKAARAFCDAFLRYLITLPKEVEIRRAQTP